VLGDADTVALVGLVFVLWTPVLPRWIGRRAEILLRFVEGAGAPGSPRAIVWGGVEEDVEVLLSGREDREGSPMETFRLRLRDGTILDVARRPDEDAWHLEAELPQADT
jgi:hypothetical protein